MTTLSRTVRLFISSTFRDFAGERDILVRRIFPELRRRCRERQVELVDVDLRWGITEAEAQQGKVLPICLAEIDRSRPYFIGLLGERYGWVPQVQQYDPALVQEQPWLTEHAGGKSVTELEVLHGVLNNPAMAGHTLFYFRSPAYAQGRGGDYAAESPEHGAKLAGLKGRIRQSGFPVVEDYPDPEALAQRVMEDLWKLIDATYPLAEVPDALTLERRRHESYGQSRLGLYLGGESYLAGLNTAIAEGQRTVLITGDSGGGKSALLANWLEAFRQAQPQAHLFVHHLGATNDAGEPAKLVRRWIQELARVLGEEAKLPGDPDKLYEELPQWLAKASAHAQRHSTRWVIVLDALDKLRESRDLRWLPRFLPEGIQLIATCLTGEVLTAAQRRLQWEQTVEVNPLAEADRRTLIQSYLGKYRKRLTLGQERNVLAHPLTGNPLFLRTLLEELRVFGVHEALDQRLAHYLTSATVDDLFERVLERIEQDTAARHVRSSMGALWASRAGLAQDELLAMTGLVAAQWAAVQLGLDEVVIESGGRLVFAHDYLRKAVEDRYLPTPAEQQAAHRKLGEHFAKQERDARVAEELPWQWQQAGEKDQLKECLTQRELFPLLQQRDELELLGYWVSLMPVDINAAYEAAWLEWGLEEEEVAAVRAFTLARFLRIAGCYSSFAVRLARQCLDQHERTLGPEHPDTLICIGSLAILLDYRGDSAEAEVLHRQTLTTREKTLGHEHPDTLRSTNNLATLLSEQGNYVEAEPLFRRVLSVEERTLGQEHPNALTSVHNLGLLLTQSGDHEKAESLIRRALRDRERVLGVDDLLTLDSANNLGLLLQRKGDQAGAEVLYRRALSGIEKQLGPDHPRALVGLANLGTALHGKGDLKGAEDCLRRALKGQEKVLGPAHLTTLANLDRLTRLLSDKDDYAGAEAICRRVLVARETVLGLEHPEILDRLIALGHLLSEQGDNEAAEPLYRRVLEAQERLLGPEHPGTLTALKKLALCLISQSDYAGAIPFYRRIVEGRAKIIGPEHPDTSSAVNMLAVLHGEQGDFALAEILHRRALAGWEKVVGPEHPDTLNSLNNLASLLNATGRLAEAVVLLSEYAAKSEACLIGVRYNLACYECLSGNLDEAKRLITAEITANPETKARALADADLAALHDFIAAL